MNRNQLISTIFVLVSTLFVPAPAQAQITVTYTFTNGTTADADQVNSNFDTIEANALNRTGGTITGNITVNAGVTIDGIDIGAVLGGTGTPTFAGVTITGTGASSLDIGGGLNAGTGNVALIAADGRITGISSTYFASLDGSTLTALNATQLTTGTVPDARFPATLPALSGANLTSLNPSNLSNQVPTSKGGTVLDTSAVAQGNLFYFSLTGVVATLAPGTAGQFLRTGGAGANPTWSNDGSNLTGLVEANITDGSVLARVGSTETITGNWTMSNASNSFRGAYTSSDNTAGLTKTDCPGTSVSSITTKNGLVTAVTCG